MDKNWEPLPTGSMAAAVEIMSAIGIPLADIAAALRPPGKSRVSEEYVRRNFGEQLRLGRVRHTVAVAQKLFESATKSALKKPFGDIQAQKLWLEMFSDPPVDVRREAGGKPARVNEKTAAAAYAQFMRDCGGPS